MLIDTIIKLQCNIFMLHAKLLVLHVEVNRSYIKEGHYSNVMYQGLAEKYFLDMYLHRKT